MDGEVQDVVKQSDAGYAVNAEDSAAFANAVAALHDADINGRIAMGNNAKQYYIGHFEREKNMDKIIDFIFKEEVN